MTLDEKMKELYKDITKQFEECQKATDELYIENEELHSIIKEVREYVRSNEWAKDYEKSSCRTHILEILYKENI